MGHLVYGETERFPFDDATLANLEAVVMIRFRAGESFMLGWPVSLAHGSGRAAVWLSPDIALRFEYRRTRHTRLERSVIDAMVRGSRSAAGLELEHDPSTE